MAIDWKKVVYGEAARTVAGREPPEFPPRHRSGVTSPPPEPNAATSEPASETADPDVDGAAPETDLLGAASGVAADEATPPADASTPGETEGAPSTTSPTPPVPSAPPAVTSEPPAVPSAPPAVPTPSSRLGRSEEDVPDASPTPQQQPSERGAPHQARTRQQPDDDAAAWAQRMSAVLDGAKRPTAESPSALTPTLQVPSTAEAPASPDAPEQADLSAQDDAAEGDVPADPPYEDDAVGQGGPIETLESDPPTAVADTAAILDDLLGRPLVFIDRGVIALCTLEDVRHGERGAAGVALALRWPADNILFPNLRPNPDAPLVTVRSEALAQRDGALSAQDEGWSIVYGSDHAAWMKDQLAAVARADRTKTWRSQLLEALAARAQIPTDSEGGLRAVSVGMEP